MGLQGEVGWTVDDRVGEDVQRRALVRSEGRVSGVRRWGDRASRGAT